MVMIMYLIVTINSKNQSPFIISSSPILMDISLNFRNFWKNWSDNSDDLLSMVKPDHSPTPGLSFHILNQLLQYRIKEIIIIFYKTIMEHKFQLKIELFIA